MEVSEKNIAQIKNEATSHYKLHLLLKTNQNFFSHENLFFSAVSAPQAARRRKHWHTPLEMEKVK
jgi:hypothetical protein